MKHPSLYLDWYIHASNVKHDFRSSGIAYFKHVVDLGEVDLSVNYVHGNPEAVNQLAHLYSVRPENVFISGEGASGLNARMIRYLAERNPEKREAIVEYPTYEPLLRAVQEHFSRVKRLDRQEKDLYALDADRLRKMVSTKTGLLVLTNPHAPSGAVSSLRELREVMNVAREYGFHVLCDEIYGEFDRKAVPTLFSVDSKLGLVTTSFTKAYGLGGLKLGVALAEKQLVDELYADVLNTVGNAPNIVELVGAELLARGKARLQRHKQEWGQLKEKTETWLDEMCLEYFPNKVGVTYWVKLPIRDTYKWVTEQTVPKYSLAPVPGAFFLFRSGYKLVRSNMVRLGLGLINPKDSNLTEALEALENAIKQHKFDGKDG
ncbi:MAG TPA: pyridoxal phosphate-dependent aminotransferase [Candidatus Acidoferrales bacterium]|nr:pyridoxal phosphate-dependent aminotransferase [Candidatus Acidoferrales bacterium]